MQVPPVAAPPSSAHKRLLPLFESHAAAGDVDGTAPPHGDAFEGPPEETPRERKRAKPIEEESSGIGGSRQVLPHETAQGQYLPSSFQLQSSDSSDAATANPVIVTPRRSNYIGWDDYFLGIAILSSQRSKDPDHAEGACIADADNRIVAIGYSGFPRGCPDTVFPWHDYRGAAGDDGGGGGGGAQEWLHSKQPYVCPAITNAILNKCSQDVAGCRLYVMEFPTSDCVKVIIQSQIREIVILGRQRRLDERGREVDVELVSEDAQASRIMLDMANIEVRYCVPSVPSILLDFSTATQPAAPQSATCGCHNHTKTPPESKEDAQGQAEKSIRTEEEQRAVTILLDEANYNASGVINNGRRLDSISWEDYFMSVAFLTAQRSKDPNTQVGACIVDQDRRIIGLGYNGMPRGLSDDAMPWARQNSNPLFNKYLYVTHAEVNAILNKGSSNVRGSTLYVALFPCENCAKMIIQAGIQRVVYLNDHYHDMPGCKASRIMLQCAKVELQQYTPTMHQMLIDYDQ